MHPVTRSVHDEESNWSHAGEIHRNWHLVRMLGSCVLAQLLYS